MPQPLIEPLTMEYSPRELRCADLLALIFIGFGAAVVPLGVALERAYFVPCGIVLICVGAALGIKVRRIAANGNREEEPGDESRKKRWMKKKK